MKKSSYTFVIAIAIFVALPNVSSVTAKTIKVFLVSGQSNASGAAFTNDLPNELKAPQTNVDFYYSGVTTPAPLSPVASTFGPEITFGRDMAAYYAATDPNTSVAIIKYAVGATSIYDDWQPDDAAYKAFHDTVTAGLAAIKKKYPNDTVQIAGMIWMQGESDVEPCRADINYDPDDVYAAAYGTNLPAFIKKMRTLYGADLPFAIGQLPENQRVYFAEDGRGYGGDKEAAFDIVRNIQATVAAANPLNGLTITDVPTSGMRTDERLHFNAEGQMALGTAFAETMQDLIKANKSR